MEYRLLGRSGLKVSALSLGTMTFGRNDPSKPIGSVDLARRAPADRHVPRRRRQPDRHRQCLYARPVRGDHRRGARRQARPHRARHQGALQHARAARTTGGNSRINLIAECERSLKRLRTDWIDLYQVHQWDGQTPVEETMEVLDGLVRSGKVRYVGCSNFSGLAHHEVARRRRPARARPLRQPADPLHAAGARGGIRADPDLGVVQGLGVLVWSPLAGGLLSGKFRRDEKGPEGSRHFARGWQRAADPRRGRSSTTSSTCWSRLREARGVSAARVALAWLLGRPGVTSVIIGGAHGGSSSATISRRPSSSSTDEELKRLDEVSRPPLLYPYWHQAQAAKDRLSPADLTLLGPYL